MPRLFWVSWKQIVWDVPFKYAHQLNLQLHFPTTSSPFFVVGPFQVPSERTVGNNNQAVCRSGFAEEQKRLKPGLSHPSITPSAPPLDLEWEHMFSLAARHLSRPALSI